MDFGQINLFFGSNGSGKANVYNWIKKTAKNLENNYQIMELNELYWFIGQKGTNKTRENTYVMTMVSRSPRQIVGFDVALDKSPRKNSKDCR